MDNLPPFRKPNGPVTFPILHQHPSPLQQHPLQQHRLIEQQQQQQQLQLILIQEQQQQQPQQQQQQTEENGNTSISRDKMETVHPKEKLSKLGILSDMASKYHQSGNQGKALECYKEAYKLSQEVNDDDIEKTCAFNLSSEYVAVRKYKKGLDILCTLMLQEDRSEGSASGDLYYNMGLCYENMGTKDKALTNFLTANEKYEKNESDNIDMRLKSLEKCEQLYKRLKQFVKAAAINRQIVDILGDDDKLQVVKAEKLCERASEYRLAGAREESISSAFECKKIMENYNPEVVDYVCSGGLWNDLGVVFTQLQIHQEAFYCFKKALDYVGNTRTFAEAIVLQNVGAASNNLEKYEEGIEFHERAAERFASLKERNGQGQCFVNLAFALCKLGDHERAEIAFHHAHQASVDSGDRHTQWQTLEGLGAISYNQGHKEKAFKYFLDALLKEKHKSANERIKKKMMEAWSEFKGMGNRTYVQEKPTVESTSSSEDDSDDSDSVSDNDGSHENYDDEQTVAKEYWKVLQNYDDDYDNDDREEGKKNMDNKNEDEDKTVVKQSEREEESADSPQATTSNQTEDHNRTEMKTDKPDDDNKDQHNNQLDDKPVSPRHEQHANNNDNLTNSNPDSQTEVEPGENSEDRLHKSGSLDQLNRQTHSTNEQSSFCVIL